MRKDVSVVEQKVPEDIEYDAYDADAVHAPAVRADGVPLGTGRLLHGEGRSGEERRRRPGRRLPGQARGDRAGRGVGVGAALVRAVEDACARGLTRWTCTRRPTPWAATSDWGTRHTDPSSPGAGITRAMRRAL